MFNLLSVQEVNLYIIYYLEWIYLWNHLIFFKIINQIRFKDTLLDLDVFI